jgi:hypothetical protein
LTADPQGKGYGQMLADITIENVPKLKWYNVMAMTHENKK